MGFWGIRSATFSAVAASRDCPDCRDCLDFLDFLAEAVVARLRAERRRVPAERVGHRRAGDSYSRICRRVYFSPWVFGSIGRPAFS